MARVSVPLPVLVRPPLPPIELAKATLFVPVSRKAV